jgi:hypothetical protein
MIAAVGVLGAVTLDPGSARSNTYVLSIGINEYEYEPQLGGAVSDAVDIAETLTRSGADVTLLRNKEATRARIEDAWRAIVGRAHGDDVVILSYAGHGGQEPDKPPLDEADGLDESFLLSDFNPDPRHKGFNERILDDTIHDWLTEAGAKGQKVIFVADACHSGSMTRSLDNRAAITYRGAAPYGLPETTSLDQLRQVAAQLPAAAIAREDELPNVTFLAATQENRKAPEVVINGGKRGALSYAFARAIEGAADANGDGSLSRFELESYIGRQVRQISEAQQAADLRPRGGRDFDLMTLPQALAPATSATLGKLELGILGLSVSETQAIVGRLSGADLAAPGAAVDLVWDATRKDVISGIGDPVAHDVEASGLQGVVDKWRVLAVLKRLLSTHPLEVRLDPDDGRHTEGSEIAIYSEPLVQPFVTVIDIAPAGTLRLLYPIPSDPPRWPAGQPYRVDRIEVQDPFGADHVLLVASDKPLTSLHASLKTLTAAELPTRLERELVGTDYRMALVGVYTQSNPKGR